MGTLGGNNVIIGQFGQQNYKHQINSNLGNLALDTLSQTDNILSAQNGMMDYEFIISQGGVKFKAIVPLSLNEIESSDNSEFSLEEIAQRKYPQINPLFDTSIESTFIELGIDGEDGFIANEI